MDDEQQAVWIALADTNHGKLLRGYVAGGGYPHIDFIDQVDTRWVEHQHHRPSPLKGKNQNTHAAFHEDRDEARHQFVKQFLEWLEDVMAHHEIPSLTLFAPPRFLSVFRDRCPPRLAERLKLHQAELINLNRAELEEHPVIRDMIERTVRPRRSST